MADETQAMTDFTARRPDDAAADQETQDAAQQPEGAMSPSEEARIAALVETLARENADTKDRLLRTLAEMENLRKRTEREVYDSRQYAIASFARDILVVADNMDRALEALDADLRERADSSAKGLLDGVELTERELQKVLEKHGVKKFDPLGEKFDPNLHQAMFEMPDPSRLSGTVAQVIQPGYVIGDRVLRPALVGVAKGGPKAAPQEPSANDNPA